MPHFKYRQLTDYYHQLIVSGEYVNGDKLPSVRALSKEHNVSISTATKVLTELELAGLVTAKAKSGYFVTLQNDDLLFGFGDKVINKRDLNALSLAESVQYSFNDESILPLSCTGPSTVLDNEAILNKFYRKAFSKRPFRLQQDNFELGLPELRYALAKHLEFSQELQFSENILITHGRSDALNLALVSLDLLHDKVAVEAPCSFFINANLQQLNIETVAVPMQADFIKEIALLDEAFLSEPFRAYIFNPNFNDPTGRLLSDDNKQALITWAQSRNVILIEYDRGELYFSGQRPKSIIHLLQNHHKTPAISIGDFSDTVSFSFSLGYMVCHQCVDMCSFTKHITVEKTDMISQMMLSEMITSLEYRKLLAKLRKQMWQQYCLTKALLKPLYSHLSVAVVKGGPCIWFKLPRGKSSELLFQRLLKRNIAIAPGKMFLANNDFENYFRITFALPWESRMVEGLSVLVEETLLFLAS